MRVLSAGDLLNTFLRALDPFSFYSSSLLTEKTLLPGRAKSWFASYPAESPVRAIFFESAGNSVVTHGAKLTERLLDR